MANKRQRKIVERNERIMRLWETGRYTQRAIAAMFKMKISTVSMAIYNEQRRREKVSQSV